LNRGIQTQLLDDGLVAGTTNGSWLADGQWRRRQALRVPDVERSLLGPPGSLPQLGADLMRPSRGQDRDDRDGQKNNPRESPLFPTANGVWLRGSGQRRRRNCGTVSELQVHDYAD
jgi:hypothetical protein